MELMKFCDISASSFVRDAAFVHILTHKFAFLNRQVREAERYNWAATQGVNEEMLFENLPEDLQRDIRRHLFKFVKKVRYRMPYYNY